MSQFINPYKIPELKVFNLYYYIIFLI